MCFRDNSTLLVLGGQDWVVQLKVHWSALAARATCAVRSWDRMGIGHNGPDDVFSLWMRHLFGVSGCLHGRFAGSCERLLGNRMVDGSYTRRGRLQGGTYGYS